MSWEEIMPTIDEMDVLAGTPVRFVPGKEPQGFPLRSDMSLTVRPWGQEHESHCMVIDDKGTSMPCPMASLVIDLEHSLGVAAVLKWLRVAQRQLDGWQDGPDWWWRMLDDWSEDFITKSKRIELAQVVHKAHLDLQRLSNLVAKSEHEHTGRCENGSK
ncbi:hypothetical protein CMI37_28120 [Candidatus Pacearchaeota archaeon]|jgi:hypothetical protein|nr:hypothetical protein [Candidatus Pacearchaeota archaeon]|tara:strand:+ start:7011 stop:7487 length:477 start_codon:yes stop_codon:yes gene_type:complete